MSFKDIYGDENPIAFLQEDKIEHSIPLSISLPFAVELVFVFK